MREDYAARTAVTAGHATRGAVPSTLCRTRGGPGWASPSPWSSWWPGCGCWCPPVATTEAPRAGRPATAFRAVDDDTPAPPRKRLAVVLNPTKLDGAGVDVHGVITRVCAEEGWDEPLFIETDGARRRVRPDPPGPRGERRRRLRVRRRRHRARRGPGDGRLRRADGPAPRRHRQPARPQPRAAHRRPRARRRGRHHRPQPAHRRRLDAARPRRGPPRGARRRGVVVGPRRHAFLVMAGLGLDAAIMDDTSEKLKAKIGWTAYVPAGMKHLLVERFKAHLSVDGGPPSTIRARTVLIGNCGKLTGGINLMPDAEPDDGTLDVVVIAPKGLTAWVGRRGAGAHQERAHHPDPRPLPLPVGRRPGRPRAEDRARRRHHRRGARTSRSRCSRERSSCAPRRAARPPPDRHPDAGGRRPLRTCARATGARRAAARCRAR